MNYTREWLYSTLIFLIFKDSIDLGKILVFPSLIKFSNSSFSIVSF